jgi:acyl carrier protein
MGCSEVGEADIRQWLVAEVARETRRPPEKIDVHKTFARIGLDSVSTLSITGDLSVWLKCELPNNLLQMYPTIAGLAEHLAQEESERARGEIPRVPRTGALEVTLVQERVLRYARFGAPGDRNVLSERFVVSGSLDLEVLRAALADVVCRHEPLRTTFAKADGRFVQNIHPPAPAALKVMDCTAMEDADATAFAMAIEISARPMLLESGPLFRTVVFKMAPEEHRLLFIFHHAVSDAGAFELFYKELAHFYEARRGGQPATLPEPSVQMADLAAWERQWLHKAGEPYQSRLDWWLHYLEGVSSLPLSLPGKWIGDPDVIPEPDACHRIMRIAEDLAGEIQELARVESATPRLVWFAVLAVLTHRKTGVEDFVIGTYVSQRRSTAASLLVGMFASMVPVRVRIVEICSFRELVGRLAREMDQIALHQEVPFEDVMEALQALNRPMPELQVIFNHFSDPCFSFDLPGLETGTWRHRQKGGMPWGFGVRVVEDNEGAYAEPTWDGAIYNPAEMWRLAGEYMELAQSLVSDPGQSAQEPVTSEWAW